MQNERTIVCVRAGVSPRPNIILIAALILAILIINLTTGIEDVSVSHAAGRDVYLAEGPIETVELVELDIEEIESTPYYMQPQNQVLIGTAVHADLDNVIEVASTPEIMYHYDIETYITTAKMVHGEAGGVTSMTERSECIWTACNRVLNPRYPDTIIAVITQRGQFEGYSPSNTYTEADYELAVDVLERFYREQHGESALEVGRTLPADYCYFYGDGKHNYFTQRPGGRAYTIGSDGLVSPYMN